MKITPKYYAQTWLERLQQQPADQWPELSLGLLRELQRRNRIKWLPEIVRLLEEQLHRQAGITPLRVTSAQPLSPAVIEQCVEKLFPISRVMLTQQHDSAVVGGIRLETANQRWDFSLRQQLNQLANTLKQ
ncbi:MAG: F0F1 ATP synthase subunit delta [Candidatus Kerfeldbacteria bacterium]|nr:F0F1 ATP synthase subunit delta [Candidatus Kerfeldbacteria bacterium]